MKNGIKKLGLLSSIIMGLAVSGCSSYSLKEDNNYTIVLDGSEKIARATTFPFTMRDGGNEIKVFDRNVSSKIQIFIPCVKESSSVLGTYDLNGDFNSSRTLQNIYSSLITNPQSYSGLEYIEDEGNLILKPSESLDSKIFKYNNNNIQIEAPVGSCVGNGSNRTCIQLCEYEKQENVSYRHLKVNGEEISRFILENNKFNPIYSEARK